MTEYFAVAVHQVRAAQPEPGRSKFEYEPTAPAVMEVDELTVFTDWAEAVAEALAYAPQKVESLLEEAGAGASWRNALRIAEPSGQLREAILSIARAIQEITPSGGALKFGDLLAWCQENPSDESRLDSLTRRVLRSALEQLHMRKRVGTQ